MEKLKQVIKEMKSSPYFNEWLLALRESDKLFSTENIKPCVIVDDSHIRSNTWDGLSLIEEYVRRGVFTDELDEFVIGLLSKSIDKYVSDTEIDSRKRFDSSFIILEDIRNLIFSRELFMNSCDLESFLKVYVKAYRFGFYSSVKDLPKLRCLNDKTKCFSIYKLFLEANADLEECDGLFGPSAASVIRQNPQLFYSYSIGVYKNGLQAYLSMGAFVDYSPSCASSNKKESIIVDWIKTSSRFVDPATLMKDVNDFIISDKPHIAKCGLGLININFDRIGSLFLENMSLFFQRKTFYSDLCALMVMNAERFKNGDVSSNDLIDCIETADWGTDAIILRNHMFGILKKMGLNVFYKEETKKEIEICLNANKTIYMIDYSIDDDVKELYERINSLTYKEALDFYKNNKGSSYYFSDAISSAFSKYILEKGNDFVLEHAPDFDELVMNKLIRHFDERNDWKSIVALSQNVVIQGTNENYSMLLFSAQKMAKDGKIDDTMSLLDAIDYKKIPLRDDVTGDSFISDCINEPLETYIELLAYASQCNENATEKLKNLIEYGKNNFCDYKFKAIMAFISHRLFYIEKEYANSIVEYAFDNWWNNINPSYLMYSICGDVNPLFFSLISTRNDFCEFLSVNSPSSDIRMAQTNLALRCFDSYFCGRTDSIREISSFFKNGNLDGLEESVGFFCDCQKKGGIPANKLDKVLLLLYDNLCNYGFEKGEKSDYLIRHLAKLQLEMENVFPIIWKLIERLFDYFDHYFSEDLFKLIERFKDKEIRAVSKIVGKYVDSYDEYMSFEDRLKETLSLFEGDTKYRGQFQKWRSSITKKNQYFFD